MTPHGAVPVHTTSPRKLHMLEPQDLQDFTSSGAMHSVLVEIRHQPITSGSDGLFTAIRHISLISELINRFTGDAQYLSEHSPDETMHALSAACIPLASAQLHYAQALEALVTLHSTDAGPAERTMPAVLTDLETRSSLHRHLDQAVKALDDARVALYRSPRDTPPKRPLPTPSHAPLSPARRSR
ncbi:hypothetical protein ACWCXK_05910 [Streptomyces sp. NPDC001739]